MPVLPEKRFIVACARLKRLVFAIPQESGLSPAEICKLQSLDECRAGLRLDQGSGDAALVAPAHARPASPFGDHAAQGDIRLLRLREPQLAPQVLQGANRQDDDRMAQRHENIFG